VVFLLTRWGPVPNLKPPPTGFNLIDCRSLPFPFRQSQFSYPPCLHGCRFRFCPPSDRLGHSPGLYFQPLCTPPKNSRGNNPFVWRYPFPTPRSPHSARDVLDFERTFFFIFAFSPFPSALTACSAEAGFSFPSLSFFLMRFGCPPFKPVRVIGTSRKHSRQVQLWS